MAEPPIVPPPDPTGTGATAAVTLGGGDTFDPNKINQIVKQTGALSQAAQASRGQAMDRMRNTVQDTLKAIDETTAALKEAHKPSFADPGWMAMAAGLLGYGQQPGTATNFFGDLGRGLGQAAPYFERAKTRDEEFWGKIADLQQKRGVFAEGPDRLEAEFQGKLQSEAEKLLVQAQMAGAKMDRPIPIPGSNKVMVPSSGGGWDIVNTSTGEVVGHVGPGTAGTGTGSSKPKATGDVPTPDASVEDKAKYLQANKVLSPDDNVAKLGFQPDWDQLLKFAQKDPNYAGQLWDVINYRLNPDRVTNQRGDKSDLNQVLADVRLIDRTYNHEMLGPVTDARKAFNQGKWGDKVVSLNTTMNHLENIMRAAAGLNNGNNQLWNGIKNTWLEKTGKANVTDFATSAKLVGDEIAKFIGGNGQVAEGSKEQIEAIFSRVKSPDQLQGAVREVMEIIHGKAQPIADQRSQSEGSRKKMDYSDLLSESARKAHDRVMKVDINTPEGRKEWLGDQASASTPDQRVPVWDPSANGGKGGWK